MNKDSTKITKEEFQNKSKLIIDTTKEQIDSVIVHAKKQIMEIPHILDDSIGTEEDAHKIEKELIRKQKDTKDKNISFTQELIRKGIHLAALTIPLSYIFLDRDIMLLILIPLMLLFVGFDIAAKRIYFLRTIYLKIFGKMLRKHELTSKKVFLNGASWVFISSVVTIYIFPKITAIVALTILIISDICAALVGRKYGKTRFLGIKKKSVEGTTAFFISAVIVVCLYGIIFRMSFIYFIAGIFSALIAAVTEALSKKVLKTDDNLTIPISFGISMWFINRIYMFFL